MASTGTWSSRFLSAPVYEPRYLETFLGAVRDVRKIPILVGILPLVSSRNAEFLHNEVPGMIIPDAIRERMRKASTKEAAPLRGIETTIVG